MKEKWKDAGICLSVFVTAGVLAFMLFYNLFNIFVNFKLMNFNVALYTALGLSVLLAMVFLIIAICETVITKSTKMGNWLSQHSPKMILFYILLNIVFISIQNETYLTLESIKDLVSVQWTIFAISVAVFLVWNVVIFQSLKNKIPEKPIKMSLLQKRIYISQKGQFYEKVSLVFNSVTLLIINVLVLVLVTCSIYIFKNVDLLLQQNIVMFSFYFCTNTLICLLMDIIRPLIQEKKNMLKATKVTNSEIEEVNKIDKELEKLILVLQEIDKLSNIDDDEKLAMKSDLLNKVVAKVELQDNYKQEKKTDFTDETISDERKDA